MILIIVLYVFVSFLCYKNLRFNIKCSDIFLNFISLSYVLGKSDQESFIFQVFSL